MHLRSCAALLLLCFAVGCDDAGSRLFEGDLPIQNVSFAADVQPIFSRSCARGGCHLGSGPAGMMNLAAGSAYAQIVNVAANGYPGQRVVPGDPTNSVLYRKLLSDSLSNNFGDRMPQGGPYLDARSIEIVRVWIAEGALDN